MTKNEIMKMIVERKRAGELLTQQESELALQHFSQKEIDCIYMPLFDHESCFCRFKQGLKTKRTPLTVQQFCEMHKIK
jgi:hypothetical protein